jgi:hypothetical protein
LIFSALIQLSLIFLFIVNLGLIVLI